MPNAGRLREAFTKLELLVCLDIQMSETAHLAHYVLPCSRRCSAPTCPSCSRSCWGCSRRPYLQATRAVIRPRGSSATRPPSTRDRAGRGRERAVRASGAAGCCWKRSFGASSASALR
ncbi:MAG: molybdopterin-dependent oxidoreductase [Sandaracinaceae bacterium]|nr:molybdopterin-dependent oxidoreductase [Sandaracinaceae bacterium]